MPSFLWKIVGLAVPVFALAAPSASAIHAWEPDDTEGPYIFVGSNGPPNARVEFITSTTSFTPPIDSNFTNNIEYTSPTGEFRVDVGSCNPLLPCTTYSGGDFQLVFHRRDLDLATTWYPGVYARADAQEFTVPAVELGNPPPSGRIVTTLSGPGTMAAYQHITGKVSGVPSGGGSAVPIWGTRVQMYDALDRSYGFYGPNVGDIGTNQTGDYDLRVPPGNWRLKFANNNTVTPGGFPTKWSGCVDSLAAATPVAGNSVYDINVGGAGTECNSSAGGPPANPPSGGGAGGGSAGGTTAGAGSQAPPSSIAAQKPAAKGGQVELSLEVSGPGTISAVATAAVAKSSAKSKTLTVASAKKQTSAAGKVKLVLKPTKAAKKVIKKKRKLKSSIKIEFKPNSGASSTLTQTATFKPAKKH